MLLVLQAPLLDSNRAQTAVCFDIIINREICTGAAAPPYSDHPGELVWAAFNDAPWWTLGIAVTDPFHWIVEPRADPDPQERLYHNPELLETQEELEICS